MKKHTLLSAIVLTAIGLVSAVDTLAQSAPAAKPPDMPLQVQVVIARYQGDKRIGSLPFTLSMNSAPNNRASVRMGGDVPVPTTIFTPAADGKAASSTTSYQMRSVGTQIEVQSVSSTEGRFGLLITISETTFQLDAPDQAKGLPPMSRTYQSNKPVHVKDGETAHFTAATDRTTGEVIRVEVTAKILK